jgi:hypothetical protein
MRTHLRGKWRPIPPLLGLIGLGVAGVYAHGLPHNTVNLLTMVDRDCADFASEDEAQAFFLSHKPGDWHRLDADSDGKACEALP